MAYTLVDTPGHSTLVYEDLTNHPAKVLHSLCTEVGIPFDPDMLRMPHDAYFIQDHEAWKHSTSTKVVPNTSKFASVFDKATRNWIEDKLRLDLYHELRRNASARIGLESSTQTSSSGKTNPSS
jgi:tryptophanase